MKIQLRSSTSGIDNFQVTVLDICNLLSKRDTEKVSFDLEECRIALYPDGTFQIFGGLVNFPTLR